MILPTKTSQNDPFYLLLAASDNEITGRLANCDQVLDFSPPENAAVLLITHCGRSLAPCSCCVVFATHQIAVTLLLVAGSLSFRSCRFSCRFSHRSSGRTAHVVLTHVRHRRFSGHSSGCTSHSHATPPPPCCRRSFCCSPDRRRPRQVGLD